MSAFVDDILEFLIDSFNAFAIKGRAAYGTGPPSINVCTALSMSLHLPSRRAFGAGTYAFLPIQTAPKQNFPY